MNENNTPSYNNYSAPRQDSSKSKIILIIGIATVVILFAALGTYAALASANKWWPFLASVETPKTAEPSLSIKKAGVSTTHGKHMLNITLQLNSQDKGYCVLTLSSKLTRLIIDDSKVKDQIKSTAAAKPCLGWSLDKSTLPSGEYKIDVKFVGSATSLTASDTVTLE